LKGSFSMKSSLPRVALVSLTLGFASAGFAQEAVPIEFYRPLKNSVSVGVRMIGGNAKVTFGNLGTIPSRYSAYNDASTDQKIYDNGSWTKTTARKHDVDDEKAAEDKLYGEANGTTSGNTKTWTERVWLNDDQTRYRLETHIRYTDEEHPEYNYTTSYIAGEYVRYIEGTHNGLTYNWVYNSTGQIGGTDGNAYVDMSSYSVTSSGATAQAESKTSGGVELQFSHIFKRYKRFEWGINFSAGASDINAKTRSAIGANLVKTTDRYMLASRDSKGNLVGPSSFPNWWYASGDDFETITDKYIIYNEGEPEEIEYTYASENLKYLDYANPLALGSTEVPVDVFGYWQIKGAYYMLRVGPIIRFPISKNWTVSVSAGVAGAYVGTDFIVDEYIELPDVAGNIRIQEGSSEKRFVPGYYGDINIERWLTVRTGFFAGYGFEKLGDYSQSVRGRTAQIDLGSSSGFRFGIITRF
jgi:hypothetical protein